MKDPDLSLLYDVYVLSQQVRTLLAQALQGSPLNAEEFAICSAVLSLQPVSTSELARALGTPVTTAHDHVRHLLSSGDLIRRRDPRDGRVWLLSLSRAGRDHHDDAARRFAPAMDAVRDVLPVAEPEARRVVQALADAAASAAAALAADAAGSAG